MAQRVAVEIARADYVEAGGLQRLRDQARVIRSRRQSALLIGGVADHQRNALFALGSVQRGRNQNEPQQGKSMPHDLVHRYPPRVPLITHIGRDSWSRL